MRYRYYKTDSPLTDDSMPMFVTAKGIKEYKPVGEVRCTLPYFSEHIMAECYGYVEFDTAAGAFPPPVIMTKGWSPMFVVMDASDEQAMARGRRNGDGNVQQ